MPPDSFNVAVLLGGIGVVVSGTQACLRTMLFPRKQNPAATKWKVLVVNI